MTGQSKQKEAATFLNLPQNIRQLIYSYVGLPVNDFIYLVPRKEALPFREQRRTKTIRHIPPEASLISVEACQVWQDEEFSSYKQPLIDGWGDAWSLLRSCKLINAEAHSFLYTNNSIVVCDEHVEYGLDFLRHMSPEHCRSLRDLYVQLQSEDNISQQRTFMPTTLEKIQQWQDAAQHVLTHTSRGTLSLHLVCEAHEDVFIQDALQPLLATAGTLKACDLRFSSRNCYKLSSIARESAFHIEGKSAEVEFRKSPFRFFDLPPEIRVAILKYTDLITPDCNVLWRESLGFYHFKKDEPRTRKEIYSEKFRVCGSKAEKHSPADFCVRVRSAYSARCKCWGPPSSLMLVSREFYVHAIHVFYSCNTIIFPANSYALDEYEAPDLNFTRFVMRPMRTQCFQHLRYLEIDIPKIGGGFHSFADLSFYLNWVAAIEYLKVHANLPALSLRCETRLFEPGELLEKASKPISEILREPRLETVYEFLAPLRALNELRSLDIDFEWDLHSLLGNDVFFNLLVKGNICLSVMSTRKSVVQWEAIFERLVMGNDYNSMVMGKTDEVKKLSHLVVIPEKLQAILDQ